MPLKYPKVYLCLTIFLFTQSLEKSFCKTLSSNSTKKAFKKRKKEQNLYTPKILLGVTLSGVCLVVTGIVIGRALWKDSPQNGNAGIYLFDKGNGLYTQGMCQGCHKTKWLYHGFVDKQSKKQIRPLEFWEYDKLCNCGSQMQCRSFAFKDCNYKVRYKVCKDEGENPTGTIEGSTKNELITIYQLKNGIFFSVFRISATEMSV